MESQNKKPLLLYLYTSSLRMHLRLEVYSACAFAVNMEL